MFFPPSDTWDCIATCFFIDTANNVLEYIETIWNILKPGGVWINLGEFEFTSVLFMSNFKGFIHTISVISSFQSCMTLVLYVSTGIDKSLANPQGKLKAPWAQPTDFWSKQNKMWRIEQYKWELKKLCMNHFLEQGLSCTTLKTWPTNCPSSWATKK